MFKKTYLNLYYYLLLNLFILELWILYLSVYFSYKIEFGFDSIFRSILRSRFNFIEKPKKLRLEKKII